MAGLIHLQVDEEALTDAAFDFVVDPHPSRNEREIVAALHEFNPDIVDVLECMVLDGTEERPDVADYIQAVFGMSKSES